MLLFFAFVVILSITFGAMALGVGYSKNQRMLERRLASIQTAGNEVNLSDSSAGTLLKADPVSSFGWLEVVLQRLSISRMLKTRIAQANSKMSVSTLLVSTVCLALGGYLVASLFIPILAIQIAVGIVPGFIPFIIITLKRSRRLAAFNRALPDAIDMMGRSLRAGHSMTASINIVAEQSVEPVAAEFREAFNQQNFGLPLRDALTQMLDHVPSQDLRVLVTGILVQKETGGNLAEILDRTSTVIRERLRIQGEIKTHTAQGRLTGWILCTLPIVMLLVINLVNPGYSKVLLDTPTGHKLIYIGLFLLVVGGLIIRQIINGIEV